MKKDLKAQEELQISTSRKSTREAIRIWRTSLAGRLILISMDSDGKQLIIV